jgi:superfamily II DNA or RNA helicase
VGRRGREPRFLPYGESLGSPDGADWIDDPEEGLDGAQPFETRAAPVWSWAPARLRVPASAPAWRQHLMQVGASMTRDAASGASAWPSGREIVYVIDVEQTRLSGEVVLDVGCRQQKKTGEWRELTSFKLHQADVSRLPDPVDRRILPILAGARGYHQTVAGSEYPGRPFVRYRVWTALLETVLPAIVGTGRCTIRLPSAGASSRLPIVWDDGPPWEFRLDIDRESPKRTYTVRGSLRRGDEQSDLATPVLLLAAGFVFFKDRVARLDHAGAFAWVSHLRDVGALRVPIDQGTKLLEEALRLPRVPRLDLPEELRYEEVRVVPRCRCRVQPGPREWGPEFLRAEPSFDYDGLVVAADGGGRNVFDADRRRLVVRNAEAERAALERLRALGARPRGTHGPERGGPSFALPARSLPRVVAALLHDGWHVEADGKLYRAHGAFRLAISSGIDWFELHGAVEYGDTVARLPDVLAALRRGENTVLLDDGTHGILPEDWLKKFGILAGLGSTHDDHLRFGRTQVGVLDALLASQPEVTFDALFGRAREALRRFDGIEAGDPPPGFVGALRGYQRDGLGWLEFLRRFGFGGCLADDMGLGKTVMVLAHLEGRREQGAKKPSLVVVPRSLVFNWTQEAARFTPRLRVLDHTGGDRRPTGEHFGDYDLVLTTYGTLRRDAFHFKDVEFDYVVLDEAQAIKNASTDSAKAARLLRGDHRLALSGTPVENHLGELWSLFEFLNPGILGAASALRLDGAAGRNPDEETRALLARALRPFILRRTKAQVAAELPARVEQTVYCELEPAQRRLYDELREYYRRSLLGRIDREGLSRAKIMVLEALLRLRQAACHPGLIDRARVAEPSGKLDVLLPRLAEVIDEGHKALVFSQFTSLLAIVRHRLDRERIPYEYLDGQTRDRAARVARFQVDPGCRLFLVSLKAGGLGLNLTAAEHVFLLDPWWNPAVEAQAIDRAHRIGQTRRVLAFRLIARDTVEEKILALQEQKRELADAIITENNSLIRTLTREDLELLLS